MKRCDRTKFQAGELKRPSIARRRSRKKLQKLLSAEETDLEDEFSVNTYVLIS